MTPQLLLMRPNAEAQWPIHVWLWCPSSRKPWYHPARTPRPRVAPPCLRSQPQRGSAAGGHPIMANAQLRDLGERQRPGGTGRLLERPPRLGERCACLCVDSLRTWMHDSIFTGSSSNDGRRAASVAMRPTVGGAALLHERPRRPGAQRHSMSGYSAPAGHGLGATAPVRWLPSVAMWPRHDSPTGGHPPWATWSHGCVCGPHGGAGGALL